MGLKLELAKVLPTTLLVPKRMLLLFNLDLITYFVKFRKKIGCSYQITVITRCTMSNNAQVHLVQDIYETAETQVKSASASSSSEELTLAVSCADRGAEGIV